MKAAIAQLEISLETLVTNEPINRAEGNTEQADLEAVNASEIRQALAILKAVDAAEIERELAQVAQDRDILKNALLNNQDAGKAEYEEIKKPEAWKASDLSVIPNYQEIGTLLNLPIGAPVNEHLIPSIKKLINERDNALSDAKQSDADSLRALHERNIAREHINLLKDALKESMKWVYACPIENKNKEKMIERYKFVTKSLK